MLFSTDSLFAFWPCALPAAGLLLAAGIVYFRLFKKSGASKPILYSPSKGSDIMAETEPVNQPIVLEETQPLQPHPLVPRALCFLNRELSWLKFNERVLEEAADETNPLCERMSFLSIFQTNLDEFFMVRVGSLHDMMLLKNEIRENKTNMTPMEQIFAVLRQVRGLLPKKEAVYRDLMDAVSKQGVSLLTFADLRSSEKKELERYFTRELQPLLSTIVVGKKQPFPFLNNKELYAVAELGKRATNPKKARKNLKNPRWVSCHVPPVCSSG